MIKIKSLLDKDNVYYFCEKCKVFFEARFKRCQICAGDLKAIRIKKGTTEEIEEVNRA